MPYPKALIKKGDIVIITGTESMPTAFLGRYGKVTDSDSDFKVVVEIQVGLNGHGALSHTAFRKDLEKVGEVTYAIGTQT